MELETVNKLYLELSQIATAKTEQEIKLRAACTRQGKLLQDIINDDATNLSKELHRRVSDELLGVQPNYSSTPKRGVTPP